MCRAAIADESVTDTPVALCRVGQEGGSAKSGDLKGKFIQRGTDLLLTEGR